MKVDLHVHTCYSRDSLMSLETVIETCRQQERNVFPFVTTAVRRVGDQEVVQATQNLVDEFPTAILVSLQQQRGRQHVRVHPRVPVVRASAAAERHPTKVITLEIWRQNSPVDLVRCETASEARPVL